MRQRGRDWDARTSIAPASSWHLQTGLIQPRNEAPSIYKERVEARYEGLQHMSYWTEDYRGLYERRSRRATGWAIRAVSAAGKGA